MLFAPIYGSDQASRGPRLLRVIEREACWSAREPWRLMPQEIIFLSSELLLGRADTAAIGVAGNGGTLGTGSADARAGRT